MTRERIREATENDAARIAEIYAPYVADTCVTFETEAPDETEMRERIRDHLKAYPYLVMEEDGRVVAYAYAGAYKARRAYAPTAEVSVYVDDAYLGGGRGRRLMEALLARLRADDRYFTAFACVTSPNPRSEALFRHMGFRLVGTYENVGWKLGAWRGVSDFILPLKPFDRAPHMD